MLDGAVEVPRLVEDAGVVGGFDDPPPETVPGVLRDGVVVVGIVSEFDKAGSTRVGYGRMGGRTRWPRWRTRRSGGDILWKGRYERRTIGSRCCGRSGS